MEYCNEAAGKEAFFIMKYGTLGRTGLRISRVALGCWRFGAETDEPTARAIIDYALDQGINLIDTANIYAKGLSEEIVGRALQGRRHQVVLATKVRGRMGPGVNDEGLSRVHIMRSVEDSLRRLQTDYIDLYQVHFPDPLTPLEETLDALNDLVRQGKVRYIGVSNLPAWQTCKALWISDVRGYARIVSVQPRYNLLDRSAEQELIPLCLDQGLGIINYSPLAQGLLSGKYRKGQAPPPESRAARTELMKNLLTEANLERVERLSAYAAERGYTVAQLAIAWLLAKPGVSAPILGATSVEQLAENLGALNWEMTPDEVAEVERLAS